MIGLEIRERMRLSMKKPKRERRMISSNGAKFRFRKIWYSRKRARFMEIEP